ncbi:TonB-dependent receptor [Budvicia diplopodorum]|uniref:TonB-dependent receptor n=1 Tax=Budvicia diplopodorum TaxID=1119056 RepID=UPI0013568D0E|nr:TonB-dependent siderophore receptor [Budvicia diplopodorum]
MAVTKDKSAQLRYLIPLALASGVIPAGTQASEDTIVVRKQASGTAFGGNDARQANVGLLGNRDALNTPFSISGFTSQYIEDRQAKSLGEVLQNDPSVQVTSPTGGILDSFSIRGFPIGEGNIGEIALNGIYSVAPNYQLLPQYLERVEVLKGPGSGLYGMSPNGGVGGVINAVTKRATAEDITRLSTTWESDDQFGGYMDVGRLGQTQNGDIWGMRFNGGGSGGDMRLDNTSKRSALGALALDYISGGFRTSVDVIDQYQRVNSPNRPFTAAAGISVPSAPNGKTNIAQQGMWWTIKDQGALLRTEYDVNDSLTLFANAGGSRSEVARLSEQTGNIINERGDVTSQLTNFRFNVDRYTLETGARGSFTTGSIEHLMTLQTSYYHDRLAVGSTRGATLSSNIYSPIEVDVDKPGTPDRVPKTSSTQLTGVALADTLTFWDSKVDVIPGVRFQQIGSDNFAANGSRSASYDESAFTPMLGLVYRPWQQVSLYANYIEGLSKGDVAPGTARNAGQVMSPYRSRQYEVGVKYDAGKLLSSLSLFQITRPSGALDSNNNFTDNSEQRNRGVELNLSGEPLDGLRLQGNLALIDAELTKSPRPGVRGNDPVGVAPVRASAGAEYDLPALRGVSVNSQLNYSDKQYIDQANAQRIGSWTTVDMGAAYKTRIYGKNTVFHFDVRNVFDRDYWTGVASYGTFVQGAPRTFLASMSVDF